MSPRVALLGLLLAGCQAAEDEDDPVRRILELPEGFPTPAVPEDNPLTAEKIELGRYLFYETRLSGNQTQSCGSCHFQELAFTDGLEVSVGSTGEAHPRNANGLTNVAYNATLTWANPILVELETQALLPLFGDAPIEMGASPGEDEVIARLRGDPLYEELFAEAFPELGQPIDWDPAIKAIASFTRTMLSGNSPFDQYTYQGDETALTDQELRGMEMFYSEKLECHHCHGGFNFTEATVHAGSAFDAAFFQNTGLYNIDGQGGYPLDNTGTYAITGDPADMGRFRPPSLRNVAVTAPYMHDGSIGTLEEVVDTYARGGRILTDGPYAGDGKYSPLKSGLVAGFEISEAEKADLIAFLGALTDHQFLTDERLSDPFE